MLIALCISVALAVLFAIVAVVALIGGTDEAEVLRLRADVERLDWVLLNCTISFGDDARCIDTYEDIDECRAAEAAGGQ